MFLINNRHVLKPSQKKVSFSNVHWTTSNREHKTLAFAKRFGSTSISIHETTSEKKKKKTATRHRNLFSRSTFTFFSSLRATIAGCRSNKKENFCSSLHPSTHSAVHPGRKCGARWCFSHFHPAMHFGKVLRKRLQKKKKRHESEMERWFAHDK